MAQGAISAQAVVCLCCSRPLGDLDPIVLCAMACAALRLPIDRCIVVSMCVNPDSNLWAVSSDKLCRPLWGICESHCEKGSIETAIFPSNPSGRAIGVGLFVFKATKHTQSVTERFVNLMNHNHACACRLEELAEDQRLAIADEGIDDGCAHLRQNFHYF